MEQDHMIILGLLALVALMVMKHSHRDETPKQFIRYQPNGASYPTGSGYATQSSNYPGEVYTGPPRAHIRSHSDKYIGKSQNVVQHIRYDNKQGMFDGMFAGQPKQNIIYNSPFDGCGGPGAPPCP
jgi:hypothetical protein